MYYNKRYKVYQVQPATEEQVKVIKQLETQDDLDFWSDLRHIDEPVHIMVPPAKHQEFAAFLQSHEIEFSTMIEDVQG